MIRLYNHTGLPDKPIKDICTWAARKIGLTGDMAVKVNQARWGISGTAHQYWAYIDWLQSRPGRKRTRSRKTVKEFGCYEVGLPTRGVDIIRTAMRFVEVALHESAHVYQYRNKIYFSSGQSASVRRPVWEKRPIEIDAENRKDDVLRIPANKRRADDLALALALAMEAQA